MLMMLAADADDGQFREGFGAVVPRALRQLLLVLGQFGTADAHDDGWLRGSF